MRKIDTPYKGENVPEDFNIPEMGIEQTDRAVFDLFDKKLAFEVTINDKATHVPVVFAAGERFALTRRKQPIRDKNNALILPIISIHRESINHNPDQGGYGTPISFRDQQSYIVRRRLDASDRDYQNIINKQALKNQKNVTSRANFGASDVSPGNTAKPGTIASRRNSGNLSFLDHAGPYVNTGVGDNIFEIITIPYPSFMMIEYEVVIWTQYMQQMNQIIQHLMARFDGQGHEFEIETREGYKLVAYVKSPFSTGDNFSEYSNEERVIKYSFKISVPSFMLATKQPGLPSPFRRFLSAPNIEFGYHQVSTQVITESDSPYGQSDINKFILSDVETLGPTGKSSVPRGQGSERLVDVEIDPFSGEKKTRFLKVLTRNQRSGETVASSRIVVDLETQYE